MKSYGEYCPIAMGAEVLGDRWTPLILREMIVGSTRFNEIHRGIPRISRSLLAQRLRTLERADIVERDGHGGYRLAPAGQELEPIVWAIGDWAIRWTLGDPQDEQLDGAHLVWRMRQRVDLDRLPPQRTVVQFDFPGAQRGQRAWMVLQPEGATVCERDEGFDVDLHVTADLRHLMRVWAGRSTWRAAQSAGDLDISGPRPLVRDFPSWFLLSPFVERSA